LLERDASTNRGCMDVRGITADDSSICGRGQLGLHSVLLRRCMDVMDAIMMRCSAIMRKELLLLLLYLLWLLLLLMVLLVLVLLALHLFLVVQLLLVWIVMLVVFGVRNHLPKGRLAILTVDTVVVLLGALGLNPLCGRMQR
jgi:hypothetical protein